MFVSTCNNSSGFRLLLILISFFYLTSCTNFTDDSEFQLLDGEVKSLSDYRGQWLLVNFWAEWCKPCLEEVPELNELHEKKDAHNLALLAFSYEPVANEQLIAAKDKYAIEYPMVATNPQPKVPFKRPNKLPAMIIISPDGDLLGPIYGKQNLDSVISAINKLKQTL